MVQRYDTITAASWQLALGRPGEVVSDLDAIDQSIRIVASTRRGQVPGLPFFGNEGLEYLDQPLNIAAPNVVRGTFEAVSMWVPAAVVERVIPTATDAGTDIEIVWHPAQGSTLSRRSKVSV